MVGLEWALATTSGPHPTRTSEQSRGSVSVKCEEDSCGVWTPMALNHIDPAKRGFRKIASIALLSSSVMARRDVLACCEMGRFCGTFGCYRCAICSHSASARGALRATPWCGAANGSIFAMEESSDRSPSLRCTVGVVLPSPLPISTLTSDGLVTSLELRISGQ